MSLESYKQGDPSLNTQIVDKGKSPSRGIGQMIRSISGVKRMGPSMQGLYT